MSEAVSFLLKHEKLEVNKYTKTLEKEAERSGRGQTALHLAIFTGRADIVKMLINDKRTNVNAIAKLDFCNPFYYATIEYIVNRSQTGISDEANRINRMTIVKLLLNHNKVQTDFVYQKQGFTNTQPSKLTAFRVLFYFLFFFFCCVFFVLICLVTFSVIFVFFSHCNGLILCLYAMKKTTHIFGNIGAKKNKNKNKNKTK